MPANEGFLEDLRRRIADGEPIEWDTLHTVGRNEETLAEIRALRLISQVADHHRLTLDPGDQAASGVVRTRWGKHVLTDQLGRGSFGDVYKAWDPVLRREAAVKLLRTGVPSGNAVLGRMIEEGQRLARVKHPNVVTVHAVEEHEGRSGLCMEFVRGRTLDELVRKDGPLSALEAAKIGVAVCSALDAVHEAGLVHRDVNGRNVMREEAGRIVLMDFGSGMQSGDGDIGHRPAEGTPLFMAPELLSGVAATPATDLYSVGVLLYFLVSGGHPAEGRTIQEVVAIHERRAADPLRERRLALPADFVTIVDKAISPEPTRRYRTAESLRRVLEGVVQRLERRGKLSHVALSAAIVVALALPVLLLLGFITNQNYQFLLGISGPFARASWGDHMKTGAQSLVAPAAFAGFVTGIVYLSLELVALLTKLSTTMRHGVGALRTRVARSALAQQLSVRDWGRIVVFCSCAFLVWVPFFGFPVLTEAFWTPLADAPPHSLRLMSKHGMAEQNAYRMTFSVALPLMISAWMILRRSARASGDTLGGTGWLGVGCIVATVVLMEVPYRYLYQSVARQVQFEGQPCYATAETESASLLFCPRRAPRVLSVANGDPRLVTTERFVRISEDMELD